MTADEIAEQWIPPSVAKLTEEQLADRCARLGATSPSTSRPMPQINVVNHSNRARVVRLADVEPERTHWLWQSRIPRGMLTLLDGDPGLGKSSITLDLAARVTTGVRMPFDTSVPGPPADVVLMTAEDHLAATIRPRLDAAGADVRRVHAIVAMPRRDDPDSPPTLAPEDVTRLESVINERKATFVIVDPLMAYLPSSVDSYRDQDVRRVLRPLAAAAERTGAAIVIVRHLRKGAGSALYRGGGSIGIVGAARSALLVAPEPRREGEQDDGVRIIASSKCNLAPPAPALRWRLRDREGIGVVEWLGVAEVSADQLAATPDMSTRPSPDARPVNAAVRALREVLGGGPVPSREAVQLVSAMTGASRRTIERARDHLGVQVRQVRTADGRRVERIDLVLPSTSPPESIGDVEPNESRNPSSGRVASADSLPRHVYPANSYGEEGDAP